MKKYIIPNIIITPYAINWHWEGSTLVTDQTIPANEEGNIELQEKGNGEQQTWDSLW